MVWQRNLFFAVSLLLAELAQGRLSHTGAGCQAEDGRCRYRQGEKSFHDRDSGDCSFEALEIIILLYYHRPGRQTWLNVVLSASSA